MGKSTELVGAAPRITQAELGKLARAHTGLCVQVLASIVRNPKEKASSRVYAANALLDRGWGKAPQKVIVESETEKVNELHGLLAAAAAKGIQAMVAPVLVSRASVFDNMPAPGIEQSNSKIVPNFQEIDTQNPE